jgi:hypothetical protein
MSKLMMRIMLFTIIFGLCIAFTSVVSVSAEPLGGSTYSHVFDVEVLDAKYCDMEGDGIENDVHVILEFTLGHSIIYDFDYYIRLTLPSGESHTYYVRILAWVDSIEVNNAFYNHADESGDYIVDIDALMYTPEIMSDTESVVFDPPGGAGGADPPTFEVF